LLNKDTSVIEVSGKEARHMIGSRRLKASDQVTLFNGEGLVANGVIKSIASKTVTIQLEIFKLLECPTPRIILASAVPKGERLSTMLDMATQLGMTDFVPLICDRSVVRKIDNKLDRYKRICINACKQSQRYFLPIIHAATNPKNIIEKSNWANQVNYLADPEAIDESEILLTGNDSEAIILLVGPEGGFSSAEKDLFNQNQVKKIRLSQGILRIETASISLLARINHRQVT